METMTLVPPDVKIVGRGVDTLVLNVSYADKQFQPIKQELDANLQEELNSLQKETACEAHSQAARVVEMRGS